MKSQQVWHLSYVHHFCQTLYKTKSPKASWLVIMNQHGLLHLRDWFQRSCYCNVGHLSIQEGTLSSIGSTMLLRRKCILLVKCSADTSSLTWQSGRLSSLCPATRCAVHPCHLETYESHQELMTASTSVTAVTSSS